MYSITSTYKSTQVYFHLGITKCHSIILVKLERQDTEIDRLAIAILKIVFV
uniref:Uncharacterized protein n=1 Tax=Arundo donax TaxID=35708 RepID=A0A0A9ASK5_ARUDO